MKSPDLAIYVFCLYGEESNKIATFIWVVEIYVSGSVANFRFCNAPKQSYVFIGTRIEFKVGNTYLCSFLGQHSTVYILLQIVQ